MAWRQSDSCICSLVETTQGTEERRVRDTTLFFFPPSPFVQSSPTEVGRNHACDDASKLSFDPWNKGLPLTIENESDQLWFIHLVLRKDKCSLLLCALHLLGRRLFIVCLFCLQKVGTPIHILPQARRWSVDLNLSILGPGYTTYNNALGG